MTLRRFEAPSRRDDSRFNLTLDDEARAYIDEQTPANECTDVSRRCTATRAGRRCTLSAGHEAVGLRHSNAGYWTDAECDRGEYE